jgi:hypothetical protein
LGQGSYPALALGEDDKVHVCWVGDDGLHYRNYAPGTGWSGDYLLASEPGYSPISALSIATSDGNVYISAQYSMIINDISNYRIDCSIMSSGLWSRENIAEWTGPTGVGAFPSIATSGNGFPYICWIRGNTLEYAHYDDAGWHKGTVAAGVKENTAPSIEIYKSLGVYLHVVWQGAGGEIYHRGASIRGIFNSGIEEKINWWAVQKVSDSPGVNENPVIIGGTNILWSEYVGSLPNKRWQIYYSSFNGSGWSTPYPLTSGSINHYYPQIAFQPTTGGTAGYLYYVYTEGNSAPYEIKHGKFSIDFLKFFTGNIAENTSWDTDIYISGDVVVDSGVTLTIEPGVSVYFMAQDDQKASEGEDTTTPEVIVYGTLIADSSLFVIAGTQYWKIDNLDIGNVTLSDCIISHEGDLLSSPVPQIPQATPSASVADVSDAEAMEAPREFRFYANYPNPFAKSTIICYQLPVKSKVSLKVYDVTGRLVEVLIDEDKKAGDYKMNWAVDDALSSGVYFMNFSAFGVTGEEYKSDKKLVILQKGGEIK